MNKNYFEFRTKIVALAVFLVSVQGHSEESTIRICGGVAAIETVFMKIKDPFEQATKIKLQTQDTGSDEALLMLESGECDLATTGIKFEEAVGIIKKNNKSLKASDKFISKSVGRDRRLVLINKSVGVKSLTKEQLKKVALGEIKNWKELGGSDLPIIVVFIEKSPGLFLYWQKNVMDNSEWNKKSSKEVGSIQDAKKFIAENPGAWTIVPGSTKIDNDKLELPEIPPFGVPIYAFSYGEPSEQIKKLYDFVTENGAKYMQINWK